MISEGRIKAGNLLSGVLKQIGLSLCLSCSILSSTTYAESIITLDANESRPYWSAAMPGQGMCGEIVDAISSVAGIRSELVFKPLKRMIEDDSNNDLGNPAFYMNNQEFAAIIPITVIHTALFSYDPDRTRQLTTGSLSALKGFRVGALKGTVVNRSSFLEAGILLEESYSQESLFKKLRQGRLDLVVEVDLVGRSVIRSLFPDEVGAFSVTLIPGSESPIAILLSDDLPDAKALGARFRRGLQKIRESGEYTDIVKKYYENGKMPEMFDTELDHFSYLYQMDDK